MSAIASRVVDRFRKQAGASEFGVLVKIPDANKAFREAVDRARHEHGHGGYSGSIGEKSDFTIRTRTPMSLDAAHDYAEKDSRAWDDKWGPAYAVPIGEVTKGKPKTITVDVEADDEWGARDKATAAAKLEAAKLFPGKGVTVKYLKADRGRALKPKTKKHPANFDEVYWWESTKTRSGGKPYKSRKEAVEAFQAMPPELFRDGDVWTLHEKHVVVSLQVSGGLSSTWRATVEVTPEESAGQIIGWYFYGLASS
jgi:hypothetical protein